MNDIEKAQACIIFYFLGLGFIIAGIFRIAIGDLLIGFFAMAFGIGVVFTSLRISDKIHKKYRNKSD